MRTKTISVVVFLFILAIMISYATNREIRINRILFLGDSLTEGVKLDDKNDRWSTIVSQTLNVEEVNLGIGGTTIAKNYNSPFPEIYNRSFVDRIGEIPQYHNGDFLIIMGGGK